jgi:hypothetical protein
MISAGELAVRAAATLLPHESRERYREQWLGELRDAPEAGMRASDVALGSLAFAATYRWPLPSLSLLTPERVVGRSRLAAGLALSTALIALTRYADLLSSAAFQDGPTGGLALFVGSTLAVGSLWLTAYVILAPIISIALITMTRGMPARVRIAVCLLVVASFSPAAQAAIDFNAGNVSVFYSQGGLAYLAAIAIGIPAVTLLRREFRSSAPPVATDPTSHRRVLSVLDGVAVLLVATLCVNDAATIWAARTPLAVSADAHIAAYMFMAASEARAANMVFFTFVVWCLLCAAVGAAVIIGGLRSKTRRRTTLRLAAAVTFVAITYAAVVDFLHLMSTSREPALLTETLMLLSRFSVIAIAIIAVGGMNRWRRNSARVAEPIVAST